MQSGFHRLQNQSSLYFIYVFCFECRVQTNSISRIELITPAGAGAIAVLELTNAWPAICKLFRTINGKTLPEKPRDGQTFFGKIVADGRDGDEVVLAVHSTSRAEIHCHGGKQVVQWVIRQFEQNGCVKDVNNTSNKRDQTSQILELLQHAPTLRSANILNTQLEYAENFQGHVDQAVKSGRIARLAQLISLGQHLVEPWKVVIAGSPNVGKSSLINALAGFERSIVSPIAGTTRDIVSTRVALDGWLFELSDTAGIRESREMIEEKGIAKAKQLLDQADLVIWLFDGSLFDTSQVAGSQVEKSFHESLLGDLSQQSETKSLNVVNKIDCVVDGDVHKSWPSEKGWLKISAKTGHGLKELILQVISALIPVVPEPGELIPITAEQIEIVEKAARS
jgi:tRNA modification GTPase